MAESIEAFVNKLQAEGVEAGRKEAERIVAEARRQAEGIVQEARDQARHIVEEARHEADQTRQRAQTDLALAARDTVLRLRETLVKALEAVLAKGTAAALGDTEFLKRLIRDVVLQYARADREGQTTVALNVPEEAKEALTAWCAGHLRPEAEGAGLAVDLSATLKEAGFEYRVAGAAVEVTLSSVVEALSDLVSPRLRALVAEATAEGKTPPADA